jgi:hypothetical protein
MAVDEHVMAAIRLRRQLRELQDQLQQSQATANEMLKVSGLIEQGIDLKKIQIKAEELPALLELAHKIEIENNIVNGDHSTSGRIAV